MKHPMRIYNVVHSEKVETEVGTKIIRVCAITDNERYRLARLNNVMPVRIEKQVKGNQYEVLKRCESISTAQELLPDYITDMKLEADVLVHNNNVGLFDF